MPDAPTHEQTARPRRLDVRRDPRRTPGHRPHRVVPGADRRHDAGARATPSRTASCTVGPPWRSRRPSARSAAPITRAGADRGRDRDQRHPPPGGPLRLGHRGGHPISLGRTLCTWQVGSPTTPAPWSARPASPACCGTPPGQDLRRPDTSWRRPLATARLRAERPSWADDAVSRPSRAPQDGHVRHPPGHDGLEAEPGVEPVRVPGRREDVDQQVVAADLVGVRRGRGEQGLPDPAALDGPRGPGDSRRGRPGRR